MRGEQAQKIYAELAGYRATGDAYHITSAEDGSGAAKAMELAMEEGSVTPEEVQYINAHTEPARTIMICLKPMRSKKAFSDAAKGCGCEFNEIHDRSSSWCGRCSVECIVTVKSIQDGFIHQTVGTRECDEECDLNYAVGAPVEKEIKCALTEFPWIWRAQMQPYF